MTHELKKYSYPLMKWKKAKTKINFTPEGVESEQNIASLNMKM